MNAGAYRIREQPFQINNKQASFGTRRTFNLSPDKSNPSLVLDSSSSGDNMISISLKVPIQQFLKIWIIA